MLRLLNENDKNEIMESISGLDSKVAGSQIVVKKSGENITASDSMETGLAGLSVFGKSTQDGTPTPDAPIEIVSVENPEVKIHGKNLLPVIEKQWVYAGVTFVSNEDGSVTANGTTNADEDSTFHIVTKDEPITLPKGTYLLSGVNDGSESTYRILIYSTDWTFLTECRTGDASFTLEEETDVFVYVWVKRGFTINKTFYPMIRLVEYKDSAYEPYTEQTLSVPYTLNGIRATKSGNYTDLNGIQWVCDEVDFERGVLIKRLGDIVLNGSETFSVGTHPNGQSYAVFAYKSQLNSPSMSDRYIGGLWSDEDKHVYGLDANIVLTDSRFINKETAQSILSAEKPRVLYTLPTPIETALTEEELEAYKALYTNKPNTTVFNDAGTGMAVGYVADAKLYIDNKFEELQALITS